MGVHELGNGRVRKGFSFHYRTPVTAGIPDRKEYRLVLFFSFFQGLVAPVPPVNWIVSMFTKIEAVAFY